MSDENPVEDTDVAPTADAASDAGTDLQAPTSPRRRVGPWMAVLVVVAALAACSVVLSRSGANAATIVRNAAAASSARSADLSISATATLTKGLQSESLSMSGSGEVDGNTAMEFNLTGEIEGHTFTEQERLVDSTVYVSTNLSSSVIGTPWISTPVSDAQASPSSLGGMSTGTMFAAMRARGIDVTAHGSVMVLGTPYNVYDAVISSKAFNSKLPKGIPADIGKAAKEMLKGAEPMHLRIDVDPATGLIYSMTIKHWSVKLPGLGVTETLNMTMTCSNYGVVVNVTPPPSNEVIPISQLGSLGL